MVGHQLGAQVLGTAQRQGGHGNRARHVGAQGGEGRVGTLWVEHRPVVAQSCFQRTGLLQALFDLGDVGCVLVTRGTPVVPQKIDEGHVIGAQRGFGKVRLLKKPPMERTLDVFGLQQMLGHHLGVGHGHQHRFVDQLRARRAQRVTNDGAPVLPHKVQRLASTHGLDQRGQVLHQGGFVKKAATGHAAGWVAAQVGCHGAKAGLGQSVHLV